MLDCKDQGLHDHGISRILTSFLPVQDKLKKIILSNNRLTKVPNEIRQFNHITRVDLRFNQIRWIESGAFKFSDIEVEEFGLVDLGDNQINHIEANAFQGNSKMTIK